MSCCNTCYETIQDGISWFNKPLDAADSLRTASLKEDGTWIQSLGARFLYIVQMIVSIVAVPLSFLGKILAIPFSFWAEEENAVWFSIKDLVCVPVIYFSTIPACFIAALVPHSCKWDSPTTEVIKCLGYD